MLAIILHLLALNERALQLPDTRPHEVSAFVYVAVTEATPRVSAELLVSLAWAESRFQQSALPGCGVMQVFPHHFPDYRPPSDCEVWRSDLRLAVRAGVEEIELMLRDRRVNGNLRRALMYRACGNAAFNGTCTKGGWVDGALQRMRSLSAKAATRSSS